MAALGLTPWSHHGPGSQTLPEKSTDISPQCLAASQASFQMCRGGLWTTYGDSGMAAKTLTAWTKPFKGVKKPVYPC